jgi:hypothetical protein
MCFAFHPDWAQVATTLGLEAGALPALRGQVYRAHPGVLHVGLYMYFGQQPEAWAGGYFPCVSATCVNPEDCPPDAGSFMLPIGISPPASNRYTLEYPQGAGLPVLSHQSVLVATLQYTNGFQPAQEISAEAWVNLLMYGPTQFAALVDGVFGVNFAELLVEPYATRTISQMWRPRSTFSRQPVDAAVFELFPVMHRRGTAFHVERVRGGTCAGGQAVCGRDDDCPGTACIRGPGAEDTPVYATDRWNDPPVRDFPAPYLLVNRDDRLRWTCTHTNGVAGDPLRPPRRCTEGCQSCGWDGPTRTCVFTRGVQLGVEAVPRTFAEGDAMPVVFGSAADDEMCTLLGHFVNQLDLPHLP